MRSVNKDVELNTAGRHRDVQVSVQGKDHGDVFLTISGRESKKEPYGGPYAVVSYADGAQVLETEDKVMTENLVVLPIPYFETSNPKGGLTVFIGGD